MGDNFETGPFLHRCGRCICDLGLPLIAPLWTSPAAACPNGTVAPGPPLGTRVVAPVLAQGAMQAPESTGHAVARDHCARVVEQLFAD